MRYNGTRWFINYAREVTIKAAWYPMRNTSPLLSRVLPDDGSLRVLSITWNMANKSPSENDIKEILNAIPDNQRPVDLVIIAAQEETRNDNQSLGKKIKDRIHGVNAYVASFDTFTEDFGRVSQTVISNHRIEFENSRRLQHATESYKFKNKGGLFTDVTIGGHTLHAAAVHLESHNNVARFEETQHIMHKMHREIKSYNDLVVHAKTATIFAGDLNTRNRTDQKNPTGFFDVFGLAQSSNLVGAFTYSGKGKPLTKANSSDANKADAKRHGETKGGLLDQTLIQGNARFESAHIVEGTTTSDHKPVVTRIRIPKVENDFEHTKQFIINEIARLKKIHPSDQDSHFDYLTKIAKKITKENKQSLFDIYKYIEHTGRLFENAEKLKQMATRESDKATQEKEIYAKRGFFGKFFFSDNSKQHEKKAEKLNQEAKEQLNSAYQILGWNITPLVKQFKKEESTAKAFATLLPTATVIADLHLPRVEHIENIDAALAAAERRKNSADNTARTQPASETRGVIPIVLSSSALFSQPLTVAHNTGTPDPEQAFKNEDQSAVKTPTKQW